VHETVSAVNTAETALRRAEIPAQRAPNQHGEEAALGRAGRDQRKRQACRYVRYLTFIGSARARRHCRCIHPAAASFKPWQSHSPGLLSSPAPVTACLFTAHIALLGGFVGESNAATHRRQSSIAPIVQRSTSPAARPGFLLRPADQVDALRARVATLRCKPNKSLLDALSLPRGCLQTMGEMTVI
jgi:hypothetical protein